MKIQYVNPNKPVVFGDLMSGNGDVFYFEDDETKTLYMRTCSGDRDVVRLTDGNAEGVMNWDRKIKTVKATLVVENE